MKYCEKCNYVSNKDHSACPNCNRSMTSLKQPSDDQLVSIMRVGGLEKERITAALEDNKIPFTQRAVKKQPSAEVVTGKNSASVDIIVRYEDYTKAEDLLIGIGAIQLENTQIVNDNESETSDLEEETFEEMSRVKRVIIRIISVILLILIVWGVVALVDYIMEIILSNFF